MFYQASFPLSLLLHEIPPFLSNPLAPHFSFQLSRFSSCPPMFQFAPAWQEVSNFFYSRYCQSATSHYSSHRVTADGCYVCGQPKYTSQRIYEGHSIDKLNYAEGVGNRKHCLQWHHFWWNHSLCTCPKRLTAWPFLLTTAPWTFFSVEESVCSKHPSSNFCTRLSTQNASLCTCSIILPDPFRGK